MLNSPVQLCLSVPSIKPSWQVQKYHPSVLVQLWLHNLGYLEHSSISVQRHHTVSVMCMGAQNAIVYTAIVPVSQFAPVRPEGQLHVSGFTHSPPFRHPPGQIAECKSGI